MDIGTNNINLELGFEPSAESHSWINSVLKDHQDT